MDKNLINYFYFDLLLLHDPFFSEKWTKAKMNDKFWMNFLADSAVIFFCKIPDDNLYFTFYYFDLYWYVLSVGFFVPILEFL